MYSMSNSAPSVLVEAAEKVWGGSKEPINIRIEVGKKLASTLRPFFENELELAFITDSDIRHIKRKHGSCEEKRGQVTIIPNDFGCIPAVLNDFDTCEYTDVDKLGNKKFLLTKNIDSKIYLVTIQRGKSKLEIKTMWKENRSGASC